MNQHIPTINKPKNAKKIPVKVMEEVKIVYPLALIRKMNLEWHDNNGVNTPYKVTYV